MLLSFDVLLCLWQAHRGLHRVLCHISYSSSCLCLQSVTYRGRPCGAQSTLSDLGAGSGSRLDVVLRLRGGGGDGGATGAESRISYLEMYASKKPDKVCLSMSSFPRSFCKRSDSQHAGSEISSCLPNAPTVLLVRCFLGPANCTSRIHKEGRLRCFAIPAYLPLCSSQASCSACPPKALLPSVKGLQDYY